MNAADLMVKAHRALTSAQKLLQDGDGDGACNRAYYAMFDAALGALQPIAHGTAGRTYVKEAEQWQKLKRLVQ